jgi:hypothetical protein
MGELDARTVQVLLRAIQSQDERFSRSEALSRFTEAYQDIGRREGKSIYLTPADKERIAGILAAEEIDRNTAPDAWRGLSRTAALALGNNEKLARGPVRNRRIAIKALRSKHKLVLNGAPLILPARCHIEADYDTIDISVHDWIVVVENWESFNDVHRAADRLDFPGDSPLVIWRGDNSRTRADSVLDWLSGLKIPVAAFVDYDPKGLVIAHGLPRLERIISPPLPQLRDLLKNKGLSDRYLLQIPYCQSLLDRSSGQIREIWMEIFGTGKALPQEWFSRHD